MSSPDFNKKAFVYKTTNLINGKIYIGVRTYKYNDKDDSYLGTGIAIKAAIKKYGANSFKRNILLVAKASYCYEIEQKLVNEVWILSSKNYNISLGGWGGNRGKDAGFKNAIAHKRIWKSKSEEDKQEIKDFLNSIRDNSNSKTGKDAVGWLGYWETPLGSFTTCREAAAINNIDGRTLRSRCRINNLKIITRKRVDVIPANWVGKTWEELGWGFTSKEVKDE